MANDATSKPIKTVLVIEFFTAGGLPAESMHDELTPKPDDQIDWLGFQREGIVMLHKFVNQLARSNRYRVRTMVGVTTQEKSFEIDPSVKNVLTKRETFETSIRQQASDVDGIFLIAPEVGRYAETICQLLQGDEGSPSIKLDSPMLLSPGLEFTRLTSDKLLTNQFLKSREVPIPLTSGCDYSDKFVKKHRWGAGGAGFKVLSRTRDAIQIEQLFNQPNTPDVVDVIEPFVPGVPVSVSIIQGPNQTLILPATEQRFQLNRQGEPDFGKYVGSRFPLDDNLDRRARALAERAQAALPTFRGYIGIDMILAESPYADCVVDVNPRLTSSYLVLEERCKGNLAEAIIEIASGGCNCLAFWR